MYLPGTILCDQCPRQRNEKDEGEIRTQWNGCHTAHSLAYEYARLDDQLRVFHSNSGNPAAVVPDWPRRHTKDEDRNKRMHLSDSIKYGFELGRIASSGHMPCNDAGSVSCITCDRDPVS